MVWNLIEALALAAIAAGTFLSFGLGVALIVVGALLLALSYANNRKGGTA